jgi:hypothetical protein
MNSLMILISAIDGFGCRIGRSYPKCDSNNVCAPIEGHFTVECEKCDR